MIDPTAVVSTMSRPELRLQMHAGQPIDIATLGDTAWFGISLGLPGWVERLSWKTFCKCFRREPSTGRVFGWNVRLRQDGVGAPPVPLYREGRAITFGHFEVVPQVPRGPASDISRGLLLDYGKGDNGWWDPIGLLRDPLVALQPEAGAPLLGWSWVAIGPGIGTPSYFLLSRIGPLVQVDWEMTPMKQPA